MAICATSQFSVAFARWENVEFLSEWVSPLRDDGECLPVHGCAVGMTQGVESLTDDARGFPHNSLQLRLFLDATSTVPYGDPECQDAQNKGFIEMHHDGCFYVK